MAKLILSMDGLVLKEMQLDRERVSIGRKPDNDIQIDNLAISGHHAVITCILDDAFLEDQNSTNGTYVNGLPVKKHVLCDNDVIELGKYRIKYLADAPASATAGRSERAALKPFDVHAMLAGDERLAADAPFAVRQARIEVLSGSNAGRRLELTKPHTSVGKPGRQVAVIAREPQGYFIRHVEGERFPLVNGRELGADAHALQDRDVIEVAGVRMAFSLHD